jgi:hypothetical protein
VCANPLAPARGDLPAGNACETERTRTGIVVVDERRDDRAQLMIRVDRSCDLRLTLTQPPAPHMWRQLARWLASRPVLGVAINGFTASQCAVDSYAEFLVPARFVHAGANLLMIAKRQAGPLPPGGELRSLTIEPVCAPATPEP